MFNKAIKIVKQLIRGQYKTINPNDPNWLKWTRSHMEYKYYDWAQPVSFYYKQDYKAYLKWLKVHRKRGTKWGKLLNIITSSNIDETSKEQWLYLTKFITNEIRLIKENRNEKKS